MSQNPAGLPFDLLPFPAQEEPSPASVAQTERPVDFKQLLKGAAECMYLAVKQLEEADALDKEGTSASYTRADELRDAAHAALLSNAEAFQECLGPRVHRLKADPQPFQAMWSGLKNFEVRRFDRDFRVGDDLKLSEYDRETRAYSGRYIRARITSMVRPGEYGLPGDVGVLGIDVVERFD